MGSSSKPPKPTIPVHIQRIVDKVVEVLPLFDKIIKEEFVNTERAGHLEKMDNGQKQVEGIEGFHNLVCDYCGADIFQSYFECTSSSCGDPVPVDGQTRDPIHICVGCAVEGRSCNCGMAKPKQRCGSDVLFKIEGAAAEAVQPFLTSGIKPPRLGLK